MYLRRTDGLKGYEEPDQLPTSLKVLWRLSQYGVHYPTSETRAMAKSGAQRQHRERLHVAVDYRFYQSGYHANPTFRLSSSSEAELE